MDQVSILAIEVDLDLVPTEDGGRETPQLAGCGEERIHVPTNLDRPAGRRRPDRSPQPRISRTSIPPGEQVTAILVATPSAKLQAGAEWDRTRCSGSTRGGAPAAMSVSAASSPHQVNA